MARYLEIGLSLLVLFVLCCASAKAIAPADLSVAGLSVGMSEQSATARLGSPERRRGNNGYELHWRVDGVEITAVVRGGQLTSILGPTLHRGPEVILRVGEPAARIEEALGEADRYVYWDRHYQDEAATLVVESNIRSGVVERLRLSESDGVRRFTLSVQEPFEDADVNAVAEIATARLRSFGSSVEIYPEVSTGQLHVKAASDSELQAVLPVLLATGRRELHSSFFEPRVGFVSEFDLLPIMGKGLLSAQCPMDPKDRVSCGEALIKQIAGSFWSLTSRPKSRLSPVHCIRDSEFFG